MPAVYARFFALSDSGRELMDHSDQYMRGRMFEEVVGLLTSDEPLEPRGYLDWELNNHLDAYRATPEMYEAFFAAVVQVVKAGVGADWTDLCAKAWQARVERILARVRAHHGDRG